MTLSLVIPKISGGSLLGYLFIAFLSATLLAASYPNSELDLGSKYRSMSDEELSGVSGEWRSKKPVRDTWRASKRTPRPRLEIGNDMQRSQLRYQQELYEKQLNQHLEHQPNIILRYHY